MKKPRGERAASLVVERGQPVVAIPLVKDGREVVHYMVETEFDAAATVPASVQDALDLAGA